VVVVADVVVVVVAAAAVAVVVAAALAKVDAMKRAAGELASGVADNY
jgi:hypothetical protein